MIHGVARLLCSNRVSTGSILVELVITLIPPLFPVLMYATDYTLVLEARNDTSRCKGLPPGGWMHYHPSLFARPPWVGTYRSSLLPVLEVGDERLTMIIENIDEAIL